MMVGANIHKKEKIKFVQTYLTFSVNIKNSAEDGDFHRTSLN